MCIIKCVDILQLGFICCYHSPAGVQPLSKKREPKAAAPEKGAISPHAKANPPHSQWVAVNEQSTVNRQ